jgi:hypothetical protein
MTQTGPLRAILEELGLRRDLKEPSGKPSASAADVSAVAKSGEARVTESRGTCQAN